MNRHRRPSSSERIAQTWRELNSLTLDNLGAAPRWLKVLLLALCVLFIGVFGWMLLIKPIKLERSAMMTQEQTLRFVDLEVVVGMGRGREFRILS